MEPRVDEAGKDLWVNKTEDLFSGKHGDTDPVTARDTYKSPRVAPGPNGEHAPGDILNGTASQ